MKIFNYKQISNIIALSCCFLLAFSPAPFLVKSNQATKQKSVLNYDQPTFIKDSNFQDKEWVNYILLDQSFVGFKEALAFKESRGRYRIVNSFGYLGKYQFGVSTLKLLGVYNPSNFLLCPELQEEAFVVNIKRNKWVLRRDIKRFVGHKIKGTIVTESGILAAAHLAGPGSVKRYLRSNGAIGFTDGFGTDIASYLQKFSAFDTSAVIAERNPKVNLL